MRGNVKWTPIAGENERRWRLVPVYKGKTYPYSSDRQAWRAKRRLIKASGTA